METISGKSSPVTTNYEYDKDNRETKVTLNNGSLKTIFGLSESDF
jgi:hypothetical protein